MSKGSIFKTEWKEFKDPHSNVKVKQLTNYKCHNHHLYFTNPGWYDHGSKLIFGSDRENNTNLFSIDLNSGRITQLTDLRQLPLPYEVQFLMACVNPVFSSANFFYGRKVMSINLETLKTKVLWEIPRGFVYSMLNCTSDGKYVCASISEDLSNRIHTDFLRGYVGFDETWKLRPSSKIVCISTDGKSAETIWKEKYWVGHVNTSPSQPNLLTFCHEGPWNRVDNRIWCLDINTKKAWKIRPRKGNEEVGHEYWHSDGIYIGYHGEHLNGKKFFGRIKYDNTDRFEVDFPHETGHIHSNDFSLIAGDAGGVVRLWKWNGKNYDGPRLLATHRCSFQIQQLHVHPRFSADGKQILYTSDMSGYGNLYLAEVPEFESLPKIKDG